MDGEYNQIAQQINAERELLIISLGELSRRTGIHRPRISEFLICRTINLVDADIKKILRATEEIKSEKSQS